MLFKSYSHIKRANANIYSPIKSGKANHFVARHIQINASGSSADDQAAEANSRNSDEHSLAISRISTVSVWCEKLDRVTDLSGLVVRSGDISQNCASST